LIDRRFDLRLPQLSWSDRYLILPKPESPLGATELRAQLSLNGISQRRQHLPGGLVILARIAEKADEFGKVRQ
jgi:hypothetical protein